MSAEGGFARICSLAELPPRLRGAVMAIGNFDGVHRAHQAVLETALTEARRLDRPAVVLTFEPHPRAFFKPQDPLFRLTPAPLRARILELIGLSGVVEIDFDAALSLMTAQDFVDRVLVEGLGVAHAITGYDFHFGHKRAGGPAFLMQAGDSSGFGVTLVDAYRDEDAQIVSSSRIRLALAEGDAVDAAGLLGYRFTTQAVVTKGRQLGRTLGYPTANMALTPGTALRHGIYAVRLRRADGTLHDGVASFGLRPTVEDDGVPLLETFLFDFTGDLYGENCCVSIFGFLRPEEKFHGLDPLVEQMRLDEAEARALLAGVKPLSGLDRRLCFES